MQGNTLIKSTALAKMIRKVWASDPDFGDIICYGTPPKCPRTRCNQDVELLLMTPEKAREMWEAASRAGVELSRSIEIRRHLGGYPNIHLDFDSWLKENLKEDKGD